MKKIILCWLIGLSFSDCREKYNSPYISPKTGYLVVEGNINTGVGPTHINLSRTTISNDQTLVYETGAIVQVEGNDNSSYSLAETANGTYASNQLNLNKSIQYRLRIKTREGKEYLSDFATVKTTPPIDSIYWTQEDGGVRIYGHTHDPQNNTRYYQWNADETWEFHTPWVSELRYEPPLTGRPPFPLKVVPITPDFTKTVCWAFSEPASVLIGSSSKLSEDIIDSFPIVFIPRASVKLAIKYSILVKQYALTEDAYSFLGKIKKNTEETGSIFDPQPSELKGNIHCTSNPAEPVIGFINFSSEETKRIFIDNSQLRHWGYVNACFQDTITNLDSVKVRIAAGEGLIPTSVYQYILPGVIGAFFAAPNFCVDCTLTGTNNKPSFWP